MSRNRQGGYSRQSSNKEWGRSARKEEAELRGLNNRARREAVLSAVDEMDEEAWLGLQELIALEADLWGYE